MIIPRPSAKVAKGTVRPAFDQARSVQDGSTPDVSGLIKVLPLMNGCSLFSNRPFETISSGTFPERSSAVFFGSSPPWRNPDEVFTALGCQCIRRRGRWRVGKTTARCAAGTLPQVKITAGVRHGEEPENPRPDACPVWSGCTLACSCPGSASLAVCAMTTVTCSPAPSLPGSEAPTTRLALVTWLPIASVTATISAMVIFSPDRCTSNVLASCSALPPRAAGWVNSFRTAAAARSSPLASTWTRSRDCADREALPGGRRRRRSTCPSRAASGSRLARPRTDGSCDVQRLVEADVRALHEDDILVWKMKTASATCLRSRTPPLAWLQRRMPSPIKRCRRHAHDKRTGFLGQVRQKRSGPPCRCRPPSQRR